MNCKIEKHKFDVIVLGSGGAGLNAAQVASKYCKTAVISKVYPTRSHTISAQAGLLPLLEILKRINGYGICLILLKGVIILLTRTRRNI